MERKGRLSGFAFILLCLLLLTGCFGEGSAVGDGQDPQQENQVEQIEGTEEGGEVVDQVEDARSYRTLPIVIDNADWTATDGLGRTIATYEEVGPPREDKYVGMFYWLWHRSISTRNPAVSMGDLLQANPQDPDWFEQHHNYHWDEPELGFYRSDDPWVMRRHLIMMAQAGIDFLFLDYTNDEVYDKELELLMEQSMELRELGIQTPYFVFFFNHNPEWKINKVYNEIYEPGLYQDLWFYWDGKPLIMSPPRKVNGEFSEFFTWRKTWAFDTNSNDWLFLDNYPQQPSKRTLDNTDIPEQIIVNKALGSPLYSGAEKTIKGSSASQGEEAPLDQYHLSELTGQDLYFAEQWSRALEVDPAIILITGWNEWTAGTWPANAGMVGAGYSFMGKKLKIDDFFMVDQFNREFNRDVEPMRGHETDNSYYMLVDYVRQYKGMKPPQQASGPQTITINGEFAEWQAVSPEYKDSVGDTMHRDWLSLIDGVNHRYMNETGRNDIVTSKVAYDDEYVYFYVSAQDELTPHTDPNWMLLFINGDRDPATGWEGYDVLVNLDVKDGQTTSVHRYDAGEYKEVATVSYRYKGNQMEIAIPRELLGQTGTSVNLQFHWADNIQKLYSMEEFFLNGDSAPDRRFDYLYRSK